MKIPVVPQNNLNALILCYEDTQPNGQGIKSYKEEMNLGHDLYIQARIKEKRTGRIISFGDSDEYNAEDDIGFFEICWWCGSPECDVRIKMIEICNRYGGTDYTGSDLFVPLPLLALRDVYAHVVNCCCFPEDIDLPYETEWMNLYHRNVYEKANLLNADKLHNLISTLDELKYENKVSDACFLYKKYIPDKEDLKLFEGNPLSYEWEFRIWNSY